MSTVWLYQTTEKAIVRKEKHLEAEEEEADEDEEVIYKIEVPANRYYPHHHNKIHVKKTILL